MNRVKYCATLAVGIVVILLSLPGLLVGLIWGLQLGGFHRAPFVLDKISTRLQEVLHRDR